MTRSWTFTDLEFYVLWSDRTGTRLPFPLRFTARTRDSDQLRRDKAEVRAVLQDRLGSAFDPALAVFAEPDIRLGINGSDRRVPGEPKNLVRMLGVRRGSRGFVIEAQPDEDYWYCAGFTVTECDALRLADEMAARMPPGEMGETAEIVLPADRTGPAAQRPATGLPRVHDSFAVTTEQRGAEFLAAPASCTGTLHIEQGTSIYGPRGLTKFELQWCDLVDDGRYIIRDTDPPVAVAADSKAFTATLNSKIAQVVRVIKDERQRK